MSYIYLIAPVIGGERKLQKPDWDIYLRIPFFFPPPLYIYTYYLIS